MEALNYDQPLDLNLTCPTRDSPRESVDPAVHLNLLTPEETNKFISRCADAFLAYMERLHRKLIVLVNLDQRKVLALRASESSRYRPRGRGKIMRMIRRKLRLWKADHGVLLTLTVAEYDANSTRYQGMGQLHAWKMINEKASEFCDELNKWRERNGKKKIKAYAKVLEEQPGRHYPHLHIYYPGLYFLAPKEVIDRLWPYGITNVKPTFRTSPAEYIIKYLSKMDDNQFMNTMLWTFKLRMYSTSRGLKYGPETRTDTGWRFSPPSQDMTAEEVLAWWINEGYLDTSQSSPIPRGS